MTARIERQIDRCIVNLQVMTIHAMGTILLTLRWDDMGTIDWKIAVVLFLVLFIFANTATTTWGVIELRIHRKGNNQSWSEFATTWTAAK